MTGKRPTIKGSFCSHLDDLVNHFPHHESETHAPTRKERELKEKRDIHALLFEQAWQMNRENPSL